MADLQGQIEAAEAQHEATRRQAYEARTAHRRRSVWARMSVRARVSRLFPIAFSSVQFKRDVLSMGDRNGKYSAEKLLRFIEARISPRAPCAAACPRPSPARRSRPSLGAETDLTTIAPRRAVSRRTKCCSRRRRWTSTA